MPTFKDPTTVLFQSMWKKAYRQKDGLTVNFKTPGGAVRGRMALYNAVRDFKRDKDFSDFELSEAARSMEIVWVDAEHLSLRIQRKDTNDMVQSALESMGTADLSDFMDPAEKAQRDMGEKLLREFGDVAKVVEKPAEMPKAVQQENEQTKPDVLPQLDNPQHKDNPFYGKRG